MTPLVVVEDVSKYYGATAAVSNLSFTIEEGEVVGLLGLNGAGKTTTLAVLSGLLAPSSGQVWVAGTNMVEEPESVRTKIGFLPEQPPLYPEMTVADYLQFVARIKRTPKPEVGDAVDAALEATDLVGSRDELIGTLSHGYRKRVGIAQAVVHRPTLILLDEPSNGLDPVQVVHMRKLIRGLRGRNTILVSSHILSEIHELCDRIFVLQGGRVAAEGSEAALAGRLAGTTKVSVEVLGGPQQVVAALSEAEHVVRHTIDREADGVTYATVEMDVDRRSELARALVQAGLGLRRLERVTLELESIFLQLTQGDRPGCSVETTS